MDVSVEFRKVIPITKAWEGDDGEFYIEGESSGPEIDRDSQFMTKECVADMAAQINQASVPFGYFDEHSKRGVLSELGAVVSAEITPKFHMRNRVRLDKDNPAAVTLHKKIQRGKQYGMSIAGNVLALAKKMIKDKLYQGFGRIRLDHVANTTKPSWAPSLGTLVAKSLEQDGFDWAEAPEYEGEVFAAVEKGKPKPDPKAGKGYMLVAELLNRLNTLFGWEKYQDKVAEENRDAIPLQDVPALQPLFPVGSVPIAPAKSFDPDGEETIAYIEKAMEAMAEPAAAPGVHDIRTLADVYDRLFWLAHGIQSRDKAAGKKDGKKVVTQLKAAMKSIVGAMKQQIAKKSEQPKPLVYGEDGGVVKAEAAKEETMPGEALTNFGQVAKDTEAQLAERQEAIGVGALPPKPEGPQPSVGSQVGGGLTNFQQVADDVEERVAKQSGQITSDGQPVTVVAASPGVEPSPARVMGTELLGFVDEVFASEGSTEEKRAALAEVGKSYFGRLSAMLEGELSEEARIQAAVMKANAPLMEAIEDLQRQLAVAKSLPVAEGEPGMVRKSLTIGVRPARAVDQQQEAPTFQALVRHPQGGGWVPND